MAYPQDIIAEGGGFARIVPVTVSGSEIQTFDGASKIDLTVVTNESVEWANSFQDTEYNEKNTTTGVTVRIAKRVKTIDATTGVEVASGDNADTLKFSAALAYADKQSIVTIIRDNTPVVLGMSAGRITDRSSAGTVYLLGRISGNISESHGEEIAEVEITVKGGEGFTAAVGQSETTFNTAMTATTITPLGRSAETLGDMTSGGLTDLLAGKAVEIDAA